MRDSQFAGTFYERGEVTLKQQIQACFEEERGPGAIPSGKTSPQPQAVIAPHAGYQYSGACAAWSYKAIGDAPLADVYIIIAPSHKGGSGLTQEPFTTPLGIVRVDQDLARRLLEKGNIKENNDVFDGEHSVEVQLPFLQFSHQDKIEQIKILPILVDHETDITALSVDIKESLLDAGKTAVIIASSDFTHYGKNFHFAPYHRDVQENIAKLDKGAIEKIKSMDYEGLFQYVDDSMAPICGTQAIALMMRLIKPEKISLEQYYTSAEITGDKKNSVSYASMVFY